MRTLRCALFLWGFCVIVYWIAWCFHLSQNCRCLAFSEFSSCKPIFRRICGHGPSHTVGLILSEVNVGPYHPYVPLSADRDVSDCPWSVSLWRSCLEIPWYYCLPHGTRMNLVFVSVDGSELQEQHKRWHEECWQEEQLHDPLVPIRGLRRNLVSLCVSWWVQTCLGSGLYIKCEWAACFSGSLCQTDCVMLLRLPPFVQQLCPWGQGSAEFPVKAHL